MKYATIAARSLLGLIFVLFGINYFAPFLGDLPKMEGHAAAFMGALAGSGYLAAVKVIEIIGGALTLSGRYTPTGLLLLGPVIVNIAFFQLFMGNPADPLIIVIGLIALFLLHAYRRNFAGIICCKSCAAP